MLRSSFNYYHSNNNYFPCKWIYTKNYIYSNWMDDRIAYIMEKQPISFKINYIFMKQHFFLKIINFHIFDIDNHLV